MNHLLSILGAVRRRERLADIARALTRFALPSGLLIAAVAIVAIRLFEAPEITLWLTALPLPVILLWALVRRRSLRATARRVDDHYGLDDQLGSALELARGGQRGPGSARTPHIIDLLKAQAEARAKTLDPRPVVPLTLPVPGLVDALAAALVVGAMFIPTPEAHVIKRWFDPPQLNLLLSAQAKAGLDLALADPLRQNLRELKGEDDVPAKTAEAILDILDKLEEGEIDRAQAFEELEKLEEILADAEEEFEAQLDEDPAILAEALRELEAELQEHEITREAGEAYEKGKEEEAEKALDDAADQAEQSKAEEEALKQAMQDLERRLDKQAKQKTDTAKELDDAERRLRREQKRDAKDKEEQERRLKRMKEKVDQLKRKQEREAAAQRRLDQLKRQAKQAGSKSASKQQRRRSLQKLGRSASQASRKSRQSNRMRGSRDSLEEAKTFVRRAGKQGESDQRRRQQFRRFSKAAKGKKGKDGKGKGKKGKSSLFVEGQVGDGPPNGMMEMPGEGEGEGEGDSDGDSDGSQGGQMPGDGIGEGSVDPLGNPNSIKTKKRNVHVKARTGRGASTAEVMRDASQHGFANEAYRKKFTTYRSFAQSALDNEAVPPAKRRAIKRYYQLIQPRE